MARRYSLAALWSAFGTRRAGAKSLRRVKANPHAHLLEPLEPRTFLSVSIGSLALNNTTVNNAGSSLTITASGIMDSNAKAKLTLVSFYADPSSSTGLPIKGSGDILLGSAKINASGQGVLTIKSTTPGKFPVGSYDILGVAADNKGGKGTATTAITVDATPPAIKQVAVVAKNGSLLAGSSMNTISAAVTDAGGAVQSVSFYVNLTPTGVVDADSVPIIGTPVHHGGTWILPDASLPVDVTAGLTVQIIAQVVDAAGNVVTHVLNNVPVVAAPAPVVVAVTVISDGGQLLAGTGDNTIFATVLDPAATVQSVAFYINKTPSGVVDSNSELIVGTVVQHGPVWVLKDAILPADIAAGTTVEIVAQATDGEGNTYTQKLDGVAVVTAPVPSITKVAVESNGGELLAGSSDNTLGATISDPASAVMTVNFFVNKTPSGVVNNDSEPITGTLVPLGALAWAGLADLASPALPIGTPIGINGGVWLLTKATLPADVAAGTTVEIIAQATDALGNTYTQTLESVSVVATPTPVVTQVNVVSNGGQLYAGGDNNTLNAWVTDPGDTVQTVKFFVNKTPSGVVDGNSEVITGTLENASPLLPIASDSSGGGSGGAGASVIRITGGGGVPSDWVLSDAVLPADVAAGTTVEIIAQATDAGGNTYTLALENVAVVAAPTPSVTSVSVASNNGELISGASSNNTFDAAVSDPGGLIQSVKFYVNKVPSGVVNSASEAISGTAVPVWVSAGPVPQEPDTTGGVLIDPLPPGVGNGETDWVLANAALPADIASGTTVEIIAQATDANGNTYTLALENVTVSAAPTPAVQQVTVFSNNGQLETGFGLNALGATVFDPGGTIQSVKFYVNKTPSGVVDANSEQITGVLVPGVPWPFPVAADGSTTGGSGGSSGPGAGGPADPPIGEGQSEWALLGATLPADVTAGSTVEIIAQATDANGNTYTQTLENVQVVAGPSLWGILPL